MHILFAWQQHLNFFFFFFGLGGKKASTCWLWQFLFFGASDCDFLSLIHHSDLYWRHSIVYFFIFFAGSLFDYACFIWYLPLYNAPSGPLEGTLNKWIKNMRGRCSRNAMTSGNTVASSEIMMSRDHTRIGLTWGHTNFGLNLANKVFR